MSDEEQKFINGYTEKAKSIEIEKLPKIFVIDRKLNIAGNQYFLNVWVEPINGNKLLVIELSRKKYFFMNEVHIGGLLISEKNRKPLSEEEMWDLGF